MASVAVEEACEGSRRAMSATRSHCNLVAAFRKPTRPHLGTTGMRLLLLALPVVLTVLMLVACGGKGGGGY
jgi:hypothetical protein